MGPIKARDDRQPLDRKAARTARVLSQEERDRWVDELEAEQPLGFQRLPSEKEVAMAIEEDRGR